MSSSFPSQTVKTEETNSTRCWHGCGERGRLADWLLVRMQAGTTTVEISLEVPENPSATGSSYATEEHTPKDSVSCCRDTCSAMLSAAPVTIARRWKTVQMPIS